MKEKYVGNEVVLDPSMKAPWLEDGKKSYAVQTCFMSYEIRTFLEAI